MTATWKAAGLGNEMGMSHEAGLEIGGTGQARTRLSEDCLPKIWSRGTHCPHWVSVQRQKVTHLVPQVLVKQDWECQLFDQSYDAIAVSPWLVGAWPLLFSAERLQKVLLQVSKAARTSQAVGQAPHTLGFISVTTAKYPHKCRDSKHFWESEAEGQVP